MHLKTVLRGKYGTKGILNKGLTLVLGKGFRLWCGCHGRRQGRKAVMLGSGKEGCTARLKASETGSSAETGMRGARCLRPVLGTLMNEA